MADENEEADVEAIIAAGFSFEAIAWTKYEVQAQPSRNPIYRKFIRQEASRKRWIGRVGGFTYVIEKTQRGFTPGAHIGGLPDTYPTLKGAMEATETAHRRAVIGLIDQAMTALQVSP